MIVEVEAIGSFTLLRHSGLGTVLVGLLLFSFLSFLILLSFFLSFFFFFLDISDTALIKQQANLKTL